MILRAPLSLLVVSLGLSSAAVPDPAALFQAIQKNDAAAVKRLLDNGLSPNVRDAEGTPAVMAAALYADAGCLQLLLDRGADSNLANTAGATALMWAIPAADKVKTLLAHGADVNARSINFQRTPLLVAASYPGTAEILKWLLDKGADIHAKDRSGTHALGRATLTADVSVVRFLVENGADPNEPGYSTAGVRRYARYDLPILEYLLSRGAKVDADALTYAANWQDPKLIEKWIALGADVNARNGPYGRTALMTAASSEWAGPATIELLLEKGANPNLEDSEGERPLDWAIYRGDRANIEVLERYSAKRGKGPRQQAYPPPQGGIADGRVAVTRAVNLLLPAGPVVFQKRACISCHSQALPAELAAIARRKGIAINEERAARNLQDILAFSRQTAEAALQGDEPAGNEVTVGYIMAALAAEGHPLDKITAAYARIAAGLQMPDGRWIGNGVSRPPSEGNIISTTAQAVRAVGLYPLPGAEETVRRAQRWLLAAETHSAEERSQRLMGLVWTKASHAAVDSAVQQVISRQQPDGGWAQADHSAPDAYATGISLYALREAGVAVTSQVYRKGVAFLLKNQYADGSWFVKTHSYPVQPYFESGFPFGHNQWISAAGTSWASLAIAHTLPDAR
ncbi:MAG: hypothetical protein C5B51_25515 [Terriglobia bacterium]|nr:MAG: hypothetical protein C5B51_25515 [Terriglobia bacterium]